MTLRTVLLSVAGVVSVASALAQPIDNKFIVTLKPGADPAAVAKGHGIQANHLYSRVLNGFAGTIPPGILAQLRRDPSVESIVQDNMVYAIGKPGTGGTVSATAAQVIPAGVARIGRAVTQTGAGVGVAVVDTGLDFKHNDLAPSSLSYNAFDSTPGQDDNGHGTHVGGIIAALNNSLDVVGVAPAATLYAVKVLDASGSGSDSDVIGGLEWVTANKTLIKVANMSLGRVASSDDSAMHTAVQNVVNAGITLVVAAGNDPTLEAKDQVPAGFSEVIAVASTTAKTGITQSKRIKTPIAVDTASYFTSDGALANHGVTISAPGEDQENISSAGFVSSVGILSLKLGGGTTRMSGTSMASPHVAGVAALLYQKDPNSTPETVRTALRAKADRAGTAPINSPTRTYSDDGEKEGIVSVSKLGL